MHSHFFILFLWSLFRRLLGVASRNLAVIKCDRLGNAFARVPFSPGHAFLLPATLLSPPGPALMRCDKVNRSAFPRDWPRPEGKLPGKGTIERRLRREESS